jgi:tricorn protease-like protein
LLARLVDLSLLFDLDLGRGIFRLHDVFRRLLHSGPAKYRLVELDAKLMAYFQSTCPNGELNGLRDSYGLRYAIAHLQRAGEGDAAALLLLDPVWMQAKLEALGLQPLLADYIGEARRTASFAIGAALTLAANALASRPRELPAQLLARLSPEGACGLKGSLERARACLVPPALVPFRPTFTPPGAELRRFEGHEGAISSVTMLADGRHVLSGSHDRTLRLWDLDTGAQLRRFEGHMNVVTSVTALADGKRVLSGSRDRTLRLWDLDTGAELRRFEGHGRAVTSVAVLADGRHALSGSEDQTLRLWDLDTGVELRRFEGHGRAVTSVAVLADGRHALSGSEDKTLRLWDLDTGAELRRFEGHNGEITAVILMADAQRVLSGSWDRTLRLWDLDTGIELACLTLDAVPSTLAWSAQMVADVVGDGFGLVHVVKLLDR